MDDCGQRNDYDVIVVGLGPAGANAAYHLGCAGIRTLAIEKKILPRRKTCAGGIPVKVADLLDFDFSTAVEQEITSAVVSFRQDKKVEINRNNNLGYVVNRSIFDYLLALRAEKAGVRISQGESVKKVSEQGRMIEVKTDRDTYCCRALIGADGAQGITARVLGCFARAAFIGLEVHVPYNHVFIRNHANKLGFYFGYLPAGYGWIFPRREDASVGIGIPMKHARHARGLLADFLESLGLPRDLVNKARGHAIPSYSPLTHRPFCRRNILLAGDAASFVDPVSGEGIYYALVSGKEAALAISESFKTGEHAARIYTAALKKHILPELRAAWKVSLPLNAFQLKSFNFFQSNDLIREMHLDVMMGRRSYVELIEQVPRLTLLLMISLFGRLIPRRYKR